MAEGEGVIESDEVGATITVSDEDKEVVSSTNKEKFDNNILLLWQTLSSIYLVNWTVL